MGFFRKKEISYEQLVKDFKTRLLTEKELDYIVMLPLSKQDPFFDAYGFNKADSGKSALFIIKNYDGLMYAETRKMKRGGK
ncbi:MAG: hypothetical protein FWD89_01420 [Firmicutes bacterium]|nr:hypothetical protein [Bacillota bacterium]MCL2770951.1 hypothetical protein [Bacillota bacterium]